MHQPDIDGERPVQQRESEFSSWHAHRLVSNGHAEKMNVEIVTKAVPPDYLKTRDMRRMR